MSSHEDRQGRPFPSAAVYFAVDHEALRSAMSDALAGKDCPDARLTAVERLFATAVGIPKPYLLGERWSPLVPPDTWESVDDCRLSPDRVMPVERLMRLLAERMRFIGTAPKHTGGTITNEELRKAWYDLRFGIPLSMTLDPPQQSDEDLNFPTELWVVEASNAERFTELVAASTDRFVQSKDTGEEVDERVFTWLAMFQEIVNALSPGEDVLVVARRSGACTS